MKKKAILFAIAIVIAIAGSNIFAGQSAKLPAKLQEKVKPAFTNYAWFSDDEFRYPVGTYSDINTEMNRLRDLYPFNTFSAIPYGMLDGYEYGYNEYDNTIVIYSDL